MNFFIKDKVALVTGANRGIGLAIVHSLIKHGANKVYAAVRNTASTKTLEQRYGDQVSTVYIDLSKPESISALAAECSDVDLVINNAGVLSLTGPLDPNAETEFLKELEVNTLGPLRIAQTFTPILEKRKGAFVQLNSIASIISGENLSTYSASKAASYSFTLALKESMGNKGIQVLSVHPGPIDTEMAATGGFEDIAEPTSVVSEGIINSLANGDFLLFPDTMAREFYEAYLPYAKKYITSQSQ